MKKQVLWLVMLLLLMSGCAPKTGKLKVLEELKSGEMAEISIIRDYNIGMSGVHFYPTLNKEKIVGLNVENYSRFYLKEGSYNFGLVAPNVILGTWFNAESIMKNIIASKKYYFLLSLNFLGFIEIEEIVEEEAEKRISKGILIPTGSVSKTTDMVSSIIKPIGNLIGLKENIIQDKDVK